MGREGPSIASIVEPGLRLVLPDMSVMPSGTGAIAVAHADVGVRKGKWYYEVTITHWDTNGRGGFGSGGSQLNVG